MAYDAELEDLLDRRTATWKGVSKRKMFGGLGYKLRDKMCVGIWKDHLIARLGHEQAEILRDQPWCRPFDITGRAMKGWLMAGPQAWREPATLALLLRKARAFVETLEDAPVKSRKRRVAKTQS